MTAVQSQYFSVTLRPGCCREELHRFAAASWLSWIWSAIMPYVAGALAMSMSPCAQPLICRWR